MRRTLAIALAALSALALAGIAGAILTSSGIQEASATFEAKVERYESRTCTGSDGDTYEIARGRYAGTADGTDDAFKGPVVLDVKHVYNVTDDIGYLEGWIKIRRGEDDRRGHAKLWAVNKGGQVDGFVRGRVNRHYANLLGNLTASFDSSSTGGFTSGQIGNAPTGHGAAVLAGHRCRSDEKPPRNSVKLVVKGTVEALGASGESITIKPFDGGESKTCKVTGDSPKLDGIAVGDHVKAECKTSDYVLTRLHEYRQRNDDSQAQSEEKRGDD